MQTLGTLSLFQDIPPNVLHVLSTSATNILAKFVLTLQRISELKLMSNTNKKGNTQHDIIRHLKKK